MNVSGQFKPDTLQIAAEPFRKTMLLVTYLGALISGSSTIMLIHFHGLLMSWHKWKVLNQRVKRRINEIRNACDLELSVIFGVASLYIIFRAFIIVYQGEFATYPRSYYKVLTPFGEWIFIYWYITGGRYIRHAKVFIISRVLSMTHALW